MLNELEIKQAIATNKSDFLNKLDVYMASTFSEIGSIKRALLKSNPLVPVNVLCIGYLLDDKIIAWYDLQKIMDIYPNKEVTVSKMLNNPIYMYKVNGKNKLIRKTDIHKASPTGDISTLNTFLPIKIIDFEVSAKVFGLRTSKQTILHKVFQEYTIEIGKSKELNAETYYVTVPYKTKNIKFCLCDIDFVWPSFKGYNFPKDKSLTVGKTVRYKKSDNSISGSEMFVVTSIKLDKFSFKNSVVTVFDGNKHKKIYAKNLKVIC